MSSKNCGGGGEQMSDMVGGSERKTVCVMSPHFLLHIYTFSLLKQVAGKTGEEVMGNQLASSSNSTVYQM